MTTGLEGWITCTSLPEPGSEDSGVEGVALEVWRARGTTVGWGRRTRVTKTRRVVSA